jgi:o-succinylbenzoate synthase
MKAYFQKRIFKFKNPAGTSRGILHEKPSWYIYLYDEQKPEIKGIGECSIIPGLSLDDKSNLEDKITRICTKINKEDYDFNRVLHDYPALNFALETAFHDFQAGGTKILHPSKFTEGKEGIPINGLIWMGNFESMSEQVEAKLKNGFKCIKIKIGAINIDEELMILRNLRSRFSANDLELRVDANGAFTYNEANFILQRLAKHEIHSIEQPIMPSQLEDLAKLCENSPVPIALDEELMGKYPYNIKRKLIDLVRPQYLVLKPSMLGGVKEATDWINIANDFDIGWWVTSALESNIGLNAIAQWAYSMEAEMPQGLGTGSLFEQNVDSPLTIQGDKIFYSSNKNWNYEFVY